MVAEVPLGFEVVLKNYLEISDDFSLNLLPQHLEIATQELGGRVLGVKENKHAGGHGSVLVQGTDSVHTLYVLLSQVLLQLQQEKGKCPILRFYVGN